MARIKVEGKTKLNFVPIPPEKEIIKIIIGIITIKIDVICNNLNKEFKVGVKELHALIFDSKVSSTIKIIMPTIKTKARIILFKKLDPFEYSSQLS